MSKVLYKAMGEDIGKAFQDGTHHNAYGAYELARCVVEGIRLNKLPLTDFFADDFEQFNPAQPDAADKWYLPASPGVTTVKPEGS